ncbi:MAG TPA: type III-B CRISPR-associated protein Cas10/Cmr2, partial [Ktedonobacteraceae bacterium]
MSEQGQWMLMFALGPVQPFIEQARKARDLWVGSLLLSTLMEAALAGIPGDIVFPAVRTVGETPDIPNKYVALCACAQEAEAAAQKSSQQMKQCWETICQCVLSAVIGSHPDPATSAIWQRQTEFAHVFEISWAITADPRTSYNRWLGRTEQLLGARKRLRPFLDQDEPGEKSAISGEREVLHGAQTDSESVKRFWADLATGRPRDIDPEGGERLDAIDIIKRFATICGALRQKRAFPSTSSLATASFVEQLLTVAPASYQPAIAQRWHAAMGAWESATQSKQLRKKPEATTDIPFLATLSQQESAAQAWLLELDGDLYFPAVFAPRRMKKDYAFTDPQRIAGSKAALSTLRNVVTAMDLVRPTPYYGVIQMDGDHMGKILGGASDKERHRAISQALSDFAHSDVLPLVEKDYPARLIYAGGDDVLAFAPLVRERQGPDQPATILDLVNSLQNRYIR